MTLFVTAVDEPIYLVPFIRRVIQTCGATVVGVAEVAPRRSRVSFRRRLSLALLGFLLFTPGQLVRLAWFRLREVAAALGLATTTHRLVDLCRERSIPFRRIESANHPEFTAHLAELGVDVLLNQTSELLREPLLTTPRFGVINRHLSLLPAYRGAWPIFWQFAMREREVGVTIHLVDRGLDTGEILAQSAMPRVPRATMAATVAALFDRSVPLMCEALRTLCGRLRRPRPSRRSGSAGKSQWPPGQSLMACPATIAAIR
jgi:folate-dependent phosphoribosylglycinamide formyltransferase PurN